jgi:LPXTG-motif cell wall-anchored protein
MVIALLIAAAVSFAMAALSPSAAQAATLTIDQCNGHGPAAEGATTGMTCSVTVVNTIRGNTTSSVTTVSRQCTLGACSSPNGTFVTRSTSLVTNVTQCNGSDNDAAHPITCDVTITNNIRADAPQARPVTAATVNQCVGSGGGGGGTVNCSPFPASTTSATITQCNGSANGGGATVACSVGTASAISRAIPIQINQCNGTGNPGGSTVTCRTTLRTNITAVARATATASASPTPRSTSTSTTTPGQVSRVPGGGVQAGGGSSTGVHEGRLLALGGALLLAATGGVVLRRRSALGTGHISR